MQKEKIRQKQNGITLIALIITIIVMLILVGVSVTVALNGGLFKTAKDAQAKTEIEKQKMLELPDAPYHFENIKKTPHSSGNGTFVYQPEFPAGVATGASNYEWSTSNQYIATVSQFSSITTQLNFRIN